MKASMPTKPLPRYAKALILVLAAAAGWLMVANVLPNATAAAAAFATLAATAALYAGATRILILWQQGDRVRREAMLWFGLASATNFIAFASLFLGRNVSISLGLTLVASAGTYACFTRGWRLWEAQSAPSGNAG
ncbi:hypothetical protein LMG32289_05389 [Cupriavidus pampae]|uniref:GtrA family protein n=2 Tax=Cupriavidus pampae TaxID=659251 RepID=A0ABM8XTI2_9BURK|nr:hypothetical protein LMG32289_05389 [Cupriavidus pampae]